MCIHLSQIPEYIERRQIKNNTIYLALLSLFYPWLWKHSVNNNVWYVEGVKFFLLDKLRHWEVTCPSSNMGCEVAKEEVDRWPYNLKPCIVSAWNGVNLAVTEQWLYSARTLLLSYSAPLVCRPGVSKKLEGNTTRTADWSWLNVCSMPYDVVLRNNISKEEGWETVMVMVFFFKVTTMGTKVSFPRCACTSASQWKVLNNFCILLSLCMQLLFAYQALITVMSLLAFLLFSLQETGASEL